MLIPILIFVIVIYLTFKVFGFIADGVAGLVGGWENLILLVVGAIIVYIIVNRSK